MCGVGVWGPGEQRLWGWGVSGLLLPAVPGLGPALWLLGLSRGGCGVPALPGTLLGALLSPAPSAHRGEELRLGTAVSGTGGCWGCWPWSRELAVPWVSKKGAERRGAGALPGNCLIRSIRSKWGARRGWGKERGAKGVASKRSGVWDGAGAAKSPAGLHPAGRAGTQQWSSHRYGNTAPSRAKGRGAARNRPRAQHPREGALGGLGGSTQHPGALPLSRAARRGPDGSRGRDRAAAGGAAGAAPAPRQTHPEDDGHRLLLRGPRGGRVVQGAGPARPGGHEGCGCEEDGPGPGWVCTVLPRLLPRHHGGRERSVCGGKLVQDPAGLRGRSAHQLLRKCCHEVKATAEPPCPGCRAGSAHQQDRAGLLRVPSGHPVPCLGAALGSDLAPGAGCQLLLRPPEPQAGGCPVRGHRLELLPVLEGKPAVRGGSRGCPRSPCAA
ncbi:mitochondrial inner membrane protein Mpv17 isoform X1 [Anas platyrhynchos]|uniref:mitochondrial inner membrane protein Mpv17 isoform X1 n=1 Tax=Anas platyrhynchos TaxID=8839 RepID=UPI003AF1E97F